MLMSTGDRWRPHLAKRFPREPALRKRSAPVTGSASRDRVRRGTRLPRPCRARTSCGPLPHDGGSSRACLRRCAHGVSPPPSAHHPSRCRDTRPPSALGTAALRCATSSAALCCFHSTVLLVLQTAQSHGACCVGGGGVGREKGAAREGRFKRGLVSGTGCLSP